MAKVPLLKLFVCLFKLMISFPLNSYDYVGKNLSPFNGTLPNIRMDVMISKMCNKIKPPIKYLSRKCTPPGL